MYFVPYFLHEFLQILLCGTSELFICASCGFFLTTLISKADMVAKIEVSQVAPDSCRSLHRSGTAGPIRRCSMGVEGK